MLKIRKTPNRLHYFCRSHFTFSQFSSAAPSLSEHLPFSESERAEISFTGRSEARSVFNHIRLVEQMIEKLPGGKPFWFSPKHGRIKSAKDSMACDFRLSIMMRHFE